MNSSQILKNEDVKVWKFSHEEIKKYKLTLFSTIWEWKTWYEEYVQNNPNVVKEHNKWKEWDEIFGFLSYSIFDSDQVKHDCFIVTANGKIQGLALCRVKEDKHTHHITYHLDDLLTAPWNFVSDQREFKGGVGNHLFPLIVDHMQQNEHLKNLSLSIIAGDRTLGVVSYYQRHPFDWWGGSDFGLTRDKFDSFLKHYAFPIVGSKPGPFLTNDEYISKANTFEEKFNCFICGFGTDEFRNNLLDQIIKNKWASHIVKNKSVSRITPEKRNAMIPVFTRILKTYDPSLRDNYISCVEDFFNYDKFNSGCERIDDFISSNYDFFKKLFLKLDLNSLNPLPVGIARLKRELLFSAIENQDKETIQLLLKNQEEINELTEEAHYNASSSYIMHAWYGRPESKTIKHPEMVKLLLMMGADPNNIEKIDWLCGDPLTFAIENNYTSVAMALLFAMKSNSVISNNNLTKIYPYLETEISRYIAQLKSDSDISEFIRKLGPGQDNALAAMINNPAHSLPSVFSKLVTFFPLKPKTLYEKLCEKFIQNEGVKLKK